MAYKFRLETVLTYRRNLEEQAELQLAREQIILGGHFKRLGELKQSRVQMTEEQEIRKKRRMTSARFRFYQDLIVYNEKEIERQNGVIESQRQVVEKVREELEKKMRNRRVVENLRDRDHKMYVKELLRKEQNESDELALLRFGRV